MTELARHRWRDGRWRSAMWTLLALYCTACGSADPSAVPLRSTASPSPAGTPVSVFAPTLTPRPTPPTRDFDGTVRGDGSSVLIRRGPDLSAEAVGACPDGARVRVGSRTADGQWFDLAWDSSSPPSTCYPLGGQERVGRVVAYINAALIAPPTQPVPPGTGTVPVGTPAMAATLTADAAPAAVDPTPRPTVATVRPPTATPPPFSLSPGVPTCGVTADGQYIIRWTVTDPRRLLAGLAMSVTGPGGRTVPAVTRTDAEGNAVGTLLADAPGTYELMGTISNTDGTVARASASVACAGAPAPQAPTASEPTATPASVPVTATTTPRPTEHPPLFLGTAVSPPTPPPAP